jgi:hypothetical protein
VDLFPVSLGLRNYQFYPLSMVIGGFISGGASLIASGG